MKDFVKITKALSDTNRVRALLALQNGELCVCRIIELLGIAPSTVSKHMSVLKQAGLVESRKSERWIYYRITDKKARSVIQNTALDWVVKSLCNSPVCIEDGKRMVKILGQRPESLCKNRVMKFRKKKGL